MLECRIYVDNPADVSRWLFALKRTCTPSSHQVCPSLSIAKALRRAKDERGGKARGWKDVVVKGLLLSVNQYSYIDRWLIDIITS